MCEHFSCTRPWMGSLGNRLWDSSGCRTFRTGCHWNQRLWKKEARQRKKLSCNAEPSKPGVAVGVELSHAGSSWLSLCAFRPSVTVTLGEMQRRRLKDCTWRPSALRAGATITSLKGDPGGASPDLPAPPTHMPSAVRAVHFCHDGECTVVCHCGLSFAFLHGQ